MAAGTLEREYLAILLPMLAGQVLQTLAITINNIYVGQLLGVQALAAVSLFFPILFFFSAFIIGLGNGAAILVGQAYGAEQPETIKAVCGAALAIALVAGIAVALFGIAGTEQLLRIMHTPPDIFQEARRYATVMMVGMVIQFVFLLFTTLLRAVGDKRTPFVAFAISAAVTVAATPLLINGWFGLPRMGVASSAYAMLLSVFVALLWMALHLSRSQHSLRIDRALLEHIRWQPRLIDKVLRIGIPTGLQMVVMSIAEMVLLGLVNRFGSDATAAYGVIMQVFTYAQFPTMAIAVTASILASHAVGANNTLPLRRIVKVGLGLNLLLTGGLVIVTFCFSSQIVGLFVDSAAVRAMAQAMLKTALWSTVLLGMAGVLASVMRAGGVVLMPTVITMSAIVLVELPAAYLLSDSMGIQGIWLAYPIAFSALLLLQALYYQRVWRRGAVHRLI